MRYGLIPILMLILASLACLSSDDDNNGGQQNVQAPTVRNYPTAAPPGLLTATVGAGFPTATSGSVINNNGCAIPAGWQAYVVTSGDTLGVIADAIGSTVATIQNGNCLTNSDTIFIGQLLYLPSLPSGVPPIQVGVTSVVVPTVATTCTPPTGWLAYRVVSGDTLGTIAESTGTTVAVLQNANCIQNIEIIYVGQLLYVPTLPSGVPTVGAIPSATPTVLITCAIPAGWQPYIVQAGDTLGIIATRFSTTAAVLQSGNCLANIDQIFAGQVLYVPGTTGVIFTPTPTRTATRIASPTSTIPGSVSGSPPFFTQNLVIRPVLTRSDGVLVTLQATIELDIGVVPDADRVRYMAGPTANINDPNWVQVGVDNDPFDGTPIPYTFNNFDPELYFRAIADNEFGSRSSIPVRVVYDPTFATGTGKPDIFPFLGFDGLIYTLEPNRAVTVSWSGAPTNGVRVEFHLVQASTGDTVINIDNTPANGAQVLWLVPSNVLGQLYGRVVYSNGSTFDSDPVNVYSED